MARPKGSKNKKALTKQKLGRKKQMPTLNSLLKQPYETRFNERDEMIALYKSIKTTPKTIDKKLQILREINALK